MYFLCLLALTGIFLASVHWYLAVFTIMYLLKSHNFPQFLLNYRSDMWYSFSYYVYFIGSQFVISLHKHFIKRATLVSVLICISMGSVFLKYIRWHVFYFQMNSILCNVAWVLLLDLVPNVNEWKELKNGLQGRKTLDVLEKLVWFCVNQVWRHNWCFIILPPAGKLHIFCLLCKCVFLANVCACVFTTK